MEYRLGLGNFTIIDNKGTEVEVGKMISTESYNKIVDLLSQLQTELSISVQQEEKKLEWFDTKDTLKIEDTEFINDKIQIECNYESWSIVKSNINKFEYPMMLEAYEEDGASLSFGLTLRHMKALRDYLNHKIEYLEN